MKIDFTKDSGERIRFNYIDECDHQVVYDGVLILIKNETLQGSESWSWLDTQDKHVFGAYDTIKQAIEELKNNVFFKDDLFEIYNKNVEIKLVFN